MIFLSEILIARLIFGSCCLSMMLSILFFIREIHVSTNALRLHLIDSIPYFRFLMMGIGLLLIMRYRPKGILPEKIKHV